MERNTREGEKREKGTEIHKRLPIACALYQKCILKIMSLTLCGGWYSNTIIDLLGVTHCPVLYLNQFFRDLTLPPSLGEKCRQAQSLELVPISR
jgi:hypothetical protein